MHAISSYRGNKPRNTHKQTNPQTGAITIHCAAKLIAQCNKVKYLGVHFPGNTGLTDITDSVRKFYRKFNNIMAFLSKHPNEMSALHLIKTYCLPSLLYGCEDWHLNDSNLHKISVAWNNCFRSVFSCCRRDSIKPLQYFCRTLPMSYLIHQRKMLFGEQTLLFG